MALPKGKAQAVVTFEESLDVVAPILGVNKQLRKSRRSLRFIFALALLHGRFLSMEAANIPVTTTADGIANHGLCSLREAIISANTDTSVGGCTAGAGADFITVGSSTYTLALDSTAGDENNAYEDDLDIKSDITILVPYVFGPPPLPL